MWKTWVCFCTLSFGDNFTLDVYKWRQVVVSTIPRIAGASAGNWHLWVGAGNRETYVAGIIQPAPAPVAAPFWVPVTCTCVAGSVQPAHALSPAPKKGAGNRHRHRHLHLKILLTGTGSFNQCTFS